MKLKAAFILMAILLLGLAALSQEHPKAEISIDYSYVHYQAIDYEFPHYNFGQAFDLNGGGGSFVYNLTKMFGVKAEFIGYDSSTQLVSVPPGNPFFPTGASARVNGNLFTYMFGLQAGKRYGIFRPYAHGLVGGAHSNAYANIQTGLGLTGTKAPNNNAFAADVGVGLDIAIGKRFAIRPFEVSYLFTDFSSALASNQNSFRYLGGIVFNIGGEAPPAPTSSCSVSPTEVLPWEGPVNATVQTTNYNPKHTLSYSWNSTGGNVTGNGTSASIDTTSLSPGTYTVTNSTSDPKWKKVAPVACSATFTVKSPRAPTVTCSAEPSTIQPGQPVTVTAQGTSPDRQRLKNRNFSASAGSIREGQTSAGTEPGSFSSTATLDTTGVAPGTINITLNVTDVHDLAGSCVASVNVEAPPAAAPPPAPTESSLGECTFDNLKKRARVDNQCKAALDSLALRLQQDPEGKAIIVGYSEDDETLPGQDLSAYRAYNCKKYLTTGEAKQGIDPGRVDVRESATRGQGKVAKLYFLPSGGQFSQTDSNDVNESDMPKDTMGVPGKKPKAQQ
jgi:outer membrane protein OmpA-like peptidoglycan-associated protein